MQRNASTTQVKANCGNRVRHAQLIALNQVGLGAIALDRDGQVLEVNDAVELGDGLELVDARPRTSHRGDQAALDAAIRDALTDAMPARRVALRRPSGRRVLLVGVLALPSVEGLPAVPAALMVVTDLDRNPLPEPDELRSLFGLTPREAEFAALLATGVPLVDAAASLRISRQHARQRLQTVFRKTETHRQGELVALLSRLGTSPR